MGELIVFNLSLTREQFLNFYRGSTRAVIVLAEDGRRVQIPAEALRRFVSETGVQGRFRMQLDNRNKLRSLIRIDG